LTVTRRILHVIPSLDRAGAEKQLVLLCRDLARDQFDLHVCALTRGGPLEAELRTAGVPVTVIGKRSKIAPVAYWRLRRHIARLRPDLVHTWMLAANVYGLAAARAVGVRRLVAGQRCVDRWKSSYQWMVERHLARHATRIVANSPGVRDYCVAHGLPAEKCVVIPGGVEPLSESETPRGTLLDELDIPHDARLIGIVGRLWPQKRVKDLIWAFELIHMLHPRAHLLIVGDGPQRSKLERYASLMQGWPLIRFLGHRNDAPRIMNHLDVLWLGSDYEGLPNVVMEAMTVGVPVVATDIPGNRDLITSGETGYLVPVGGRKERVKATHRLLEDAELADRLTRAARQRVVEHFSVSRMVERHADLYRELLAE